MLAKLRDGTEEFKCAVTIDSHPQVKHWVRNLERDVEGAFWLPTSHWISMSVATNDRASAARSISTFDRIGSVCRRSMMPLTGKFYPDFVCELDDGRLLVVEYKGEHLRNVPSEIEKDQVGRPWAAKSAGRCLFLMAFAKDARGRDVRGQLEAGLGARS